MRSRTEAEEQTVRSFLEPHFGVGYKPDPPGPAEKKLIEQVLGFVAKSFARMRYVLGLGLDFALLAQQLSLHDATAKPARPKLTLEEIFERYSLVKERAGRQANTLSLKHDSQTIGIRKIEESVVDLFGELNRPGYPSAYVYNTGQWQKYQDTLLLPCFQLSEAGRYHLCQALIDFGLSSLTENRFFGREIPRVRLFEEIVAKYPRSSPQENAGAVFQAIAYGYFNADRPHLSLVVDKTRTGSARQKRFGDIDGYYGLDLELSVEVKDHEVTADNVVKELGEFLAKAGKTGVHGIAVVLSADRGAVEFMHKYNVAVLTLSQMLVDASRWDWRKQDAAVHGVLHYLAHVEQNPDAVARLLAFVQERDPSHDSLAYYKAAEDDAASAETE